MLSWKLPSTPHATTSPAPEGGVITQGNVVLPSGLDVQPETWATRAARETATTKAHSVRQGRWARSVCLALGLGVPAVTPAAAF